MSNGNFAPLLFGQFATPRAATAAMSARDEVADETTEQKAHHEDRHHQQKQRCLHRASFPPSREKCPEQKRASVFFHTTLPAICLATFCAKAQIERVKKKLSLAARIRALKPGDCFIVASPAERNAALNAARQLRQAGVLELEIKTFEQEKYPGTFKVVAI